MEGLKWLALGLMTLDHIDKYLLGQRVQILFYAGRLAFPLFAFVLAYNLARPGTLERGVYLRLLGRLAVTAAIAEIPFIALGGLMWGWYPYNILVALLVAGVILWLVDVGGWWRYALAGLLFVTGGAMVEFWWPGIVMVLAARSYCRRANWPALAIWIGSTAALAFVNGNCWALAAFPVIFYAPHAQWRIPRVRWAFYVYYPAHLAMLWGIKVLMVR